MALLLVQAKKAGLGKLGSWSWVLWTWVLAISPRSPAMLLLVGVVTGGAGGWDVLCLMPYVLRGPELAI
jgi:hypothetical protein